MTHAEFPGAFVKVEELASNSKASSADFRIKVAMVLFALEESLGSYVTENSPDLEEIPVGIRNSVASRTKDTGNAPTVRHIVQSTYISEILDLATATSKHKADHMHLKRLKGLSEDLGVFDIRNAVCHPNRPFPECFWHRMAAIATDPAIDCLQLKRVSSAFRAAQEGRIESPPEDWFLRKVWAVPNNIPETFDHEITGLIGRDKEAADLKDKLRRSRFPLVAIVGPGGTGKTALCLEVLNECRFDPATLEWTDEIVYVTAKLEKLTPAGIERIENPVDSITNVKEYVVRALSQTNDVDQNLSCEDVIDCLCDRRILLCLDNLETLVRDHPRAFDEFYSSLPSSWRVLITSRVPVDSATILPINSISESSAIHLARDYLVKRGGERLADETLRRIAEACDRNPLAIRLVVENYLSGNSLDEALRHTRDDIISFSYRRLLESLVPCSVEILADISHMG